MRKWLQLFVITIISIYVLGACRDNTSVNDETEETAKDGSESYVIGVTQLLEHPSLDNAYEGFQEAIEEAGLDVEYDYQNAQNDQNNVKPIADNFVADNVDLIFANSTPSALGALNATSDIPILFTSVTDAVDAGLVDSMENHDSNITGVLDLHPNAIDKAVEFIDDNFADANIGLIYNSGEANSVTQIENVNKAVKGTS